MKKKAREKEKDTELDVAEAADDSGEESQSSDARPLVVCDENGGFLFLASTNRKGYTKSIEQGELWTLHPDTGKILPGGKEGRMKLIQDRKDYYYAEVIGAGKPEAKTSEPAAPEEDSSRMGILDELTALIARRKQENPEGSYTAYLFQSGTEKIRKKTGEEAVELILARGRDEIIYEAADLIYHMLVLLTAEDIPMSLVLDELKSRK
ncbi:MAG: phosphoribosyl-ATP diphosphatase [Spirochaetales bacterium]|jgi:phosphoribosyl-ATP pyrophosphohydrolase|nr:phosphoribosyl-ATP diphosphatase [Spirochaetales bacterium]